MINGEYWLTGDAYSTFADGDVGDYNHAMYAFGSAIGLDEDQLSKLYDAGVEANANGIDFRAAAEAWIKEKLEPDYHELDWTDPNLLMAIREQDTVLDCMKEFVGLFGPDIESHCTDEDVIRSLGMAYLVEAGANEDYLKWYLSDPQGDPRDYAIEHMGWIRVDGDSFQMWTFTDGELSEIRNFDGWPEEDDDDNELKSSSQDVGIEELSTNKHFSVPLRMLFDEQLSAKDIVALMENEEALGKYEHANKQYEGEEHEHLALNPALQVPLEDHEDYIDIGHGKGGVSWVWSHNANKIQLRSHMANEYYHFKGRYDPKTHEASVLSPDHDDIVPDWLLVRLEEKFGTGLRVVAFNPGGSTMNNSLKLNKRIWRLVVRRATPRLREDPRRADQDACERAVNAALEETGIDVGSLRTGQIEGLWADVLCAAATLDELQR